MKTLIVCLILLQAVNAHAKLDASEEQGLSDTQSLLKSSSKRNEYFKKNKDAQQTDDKVSALAGSKENKEEIYDLSSQIMETITRESNGDAGKMQQLLNEAQKNPQAFYDRYFSAEQKAKLKKIAEKSDSRKPSAEPQH
jgi:hypothetical protein